MRRVAVLARPVDQTHRLILYRSPDGVYLFLSASAEDAGAFADEWYASVQDAEQSALERFGVTASDWQPVPDPLPDCQADWLAPVRVRGRNLGKPEWGKLERLEGDVWCPLETGRKGEGPI
jgi:biofilm protein TabA